MCCVFDGICSSAAFFCCVRTGSAFVFTETGRTAAATQLTYKSHQPPFRPRLRRCFCFFGRNFCFFVLNGSTRYYFCNPPPLFYLYQSVAVDQPLFPYYRSALMCFFSLICVSPLPTFSLFSQFSLCAEELSTFVLVGFQFFFTFLLRFFNYFCIVF